MATMDCLTSAWCIHSGRVIYLQVYTPLMSSMDCPKCGGSVSRLYVRRKEAGKTKWIITDYVWCYRCQKPVLSNATEDELDGEPAYIVAKTTEDTRPVPLRFRIQESKAKFTPPGVLDPDKPAPDLSK